MSIKFRASAQAEKLRLININVVQPRISTAEEDRMQLWRFGGEFMVRAWQERDDPHANDWANSSDMIGYTVVYASGRTETDWMPVGMACLRNAVMGAMAGGGAYSFFNANKVHRRKADQLAERIGLKLDGDIQINHTIKYIHAPGTFAISEGELLVFKGFCEENIHLLWRKFLIDRRDLIEEDFYLNDVRRRRTQRLYSRIFDFTLFAGEGRKRPTMVRELRNRQSGLSC